MTSAAVLLAAPFALPDRGPNPVWLLLLLAGMSVLPFLLVTFTSFTKISVVLSLTRSALGTQQAPPTMVLTAARPVRTIVGGACWVPSADRVRDSTTLDRKSVV